MVLVALLSSRAVMSESVGVSFKLFSSVVDRETSASRVAAVANLTAVRRVFRSSPKHEVAHAAAGLDRWYEGASTSAETATLAAQTLRADPEVESADVKPGVKAFPNDGTL